jgi:hypothetical protein
MVVFKKSGAAAIEPTAVSTIERIGRLAACWRLSSLGQAMGVTLTQPYTTVDPVQIFTFLYKMHGPW